MHLYLILLLITRGIPLQVLDESGVPVTGAAVMLQDSTFHVTNTDGEVLLPDSTAFVTVTALGHGSWSGNIPDTKTVTLSREPVFTGTVFTVTGARQGGEEVLPSSSRMGRRELDMLQTGGIRSAAIYSPGLHIREYGGAVPVISVSVRGSSPSQTGYFLDGHDISGFSDGLPGITISPLALGGMEISRGGGSAFLKGGMAGSVNLMTEQASAPSRASASAAGDGSASAAASFSLGRNRMTLALRRLKGTAGTTGLDGTLILTGATEDMAYGFLTAATAGETQAPDWSTPGDGERQRYSIDGWGRYSMGDLVIFADARAGRHIYNEESPSTIHDVHDELSVSAAFEYSLHLRTLNGSVSGTTGHDAVSSSSLGERRATSGEMSLMLRLPWTVSLETAASVDFRTGGEPLAGLRSMAETAVADSILTIYLAASRDFRRPGMNDLYWPRDQFAEGNPDLVPERAWEGEAGFSLRPADFLQLRSAVFTGRIENMIRWEPGEGGLWSPLNVAEATRRGLETELTCSLAGLNASAALTLLEVRDDCPGSVNYGRTLPYVPDYTSSASLDFQLPRGVTWSFSAMGTGVRFQNYSETSIIPAYWLLNTGVSAEVLPEEGISMSLEATNLFDEEYLETNGYSGRGRTLHLGIQWKGRE